MSSATGGRSDEIIGNYSGERPPMLYTNPRPLVLNAAHPLPVHRPLVLPHILLPPHTMAAGVYAENEAKGYIHFELELTTDFSPATAHVPDAEELTGFSRVFGWIVPTLRTSEYVVLQTVGLDATVVSGVGVG